jgi:PIN domain nuclease of toxin-antitoxin system
MRLLLDTHVVLWWLVNSKSLGSKAKQSIAQADQVYVSLASAWEFFIKKALGKLDLDRDFEAAIDSAHFSKLPMTFKHARAIGEIQKHHKDPFDRMLIAQAMIENLVLVTADKKLSSYPVTILDAEL